MLNTKPAQHTGECFPAPLACSPLLMSSFPALPAELQLSRLQALQMQKSQDFSTMTGMCPSMSSLHPSMLNVLPCGTATNNCFVGPTPLPTSPPAPTSSKKRNRDSGDSPPPRRKRKLGVNREKRAWTYESTVLLLQCAKEMLHCELKEISAVLSTKLYAKHGGRAAEKKLKRLVQFDNWRSCNKRDIEHRIDVLLRVLKAEPQLTDTELLSLARNVRPSLFQ